jgi:hypothetical protein
VRRVLGNKFRLSVDNSTFGESRPDSVNIITTSGSGS